MHVCVCGSHTVEAYSSVGRTREESIFSIVFRMFKSIFHQLSKIARSSRRPWPSIGDLNLQCIILYYMYTLIMHFRLQYNSQWNVRRRSISVLSEQLHEPRTMWNLFNRPDQSYDYACRQWLPHRTMLRRFTGMTFLDMFIYFSSITKRSITGGFLREKIYLNS